MRKSDFGLTLAAALLLGCGAVTEAVPVDEEDLSGVELAANLPLGSAALVYNTGGDGLNLRGGAGTQYKVLLTMPEGAQVKVLAGPQGAFYQVDYQGRKGWAHQGFLRPAAGPAACAHHALLTAGLHPDASDQLRCIGVSAGQITQTIGDAPASAGYHAKDGTAAGRAYTAAVDLSVRGLSEAAIRALLGRLGQAGFAAWYRKPGHDGWPSSEAPHIHAVYGGCAMKEALRGQQRDFHGGLNGLASHTRYTFWSAPQAVKDAVWRLFQRAN